MADAAPTSAQIAALTSYTNAEMLTLVKAAIAQLLFNPTALVSVAGRSFTRESLGDLQEAERYYRELVNLDTQIAAASAGGGAMLTSFQDSEGGSSAEEC